MLERYLQCVQKKKEKKRNKSHLRRRKQAPFASYHNILNVCSPTQHYGSITISLIHGYGLAVSASKIMFA